MPKLPRVTAREAERAILKDGWYVVGGSGSHRQYRQSTKGGRVTIAMHAGAVLTPKAIASIIAQAGASTSSEGCSKEAPVRRYTVLLYPEEGGYSALVPVLGVATQGDTVEDALAMARDLIEVTLNGLIEDNEPVPEEETPPMVVTVDVPASVAATA